MDVRASDLRVVTSDGNGPAGTIRPAGPIRQRERVAVLRRPCSLPAVSFRFARPYPWPLLSAEIAGDTVAAALASRRPQLQTSAAASAMYNRHATTDQTVHAEIDDELWLASLLLERGKGPILSSWYICRSYSSAHENSRNTPFGLHLNAYSANWWPNKNLHFTR